VSSSERAAAGRIAVRPARPSRSWSLVRLARPTHWIKNAFVLAPLLFTFRSASRESAIRALLATGAFCLVSSAAYALNDLADRERDRRDPERRSRPLASGVVQPPGAVALAVGLCLAASALCLLLPPLAAGAIGAYLLLQVAYTLYLKRLVILDVMAIAAGFILRIVAGAEALPVALSPWMIHTSFFLSLFLGFSKRRHEIGAAAGRRRRAVLGQYSIGVLDLMTAISAGLTVVMYAMYLMQPAGSLRPPPASLIWTLPLVTYGILRYLFLVLRRDRGGDVADLLLGDRPMQVDIVLWVAAVAALLALAP
jgi:4-hydroxybenzoate polyprenyltransferase